MEKEKEKEKVFIVRLAGWLAGWLADGLGGLDGLIYTTVYMYVCMVCTEADRGQDRAGQDRTSK